MCDLHLITPKAKWLPSDYHLCWICQKLAIPHPAGALLSHCGDGLQYETRQICAHPLCSRQSLDYINPPFQTGFTFHHFINRVSGVEDEMSIHSREWGQQLKSRGIFTHWASNRGAELMKKGLFPCPSAWPSAPFSRNFTPSLTSLVKYSWISNAEIYDVQMNSLEMGTATHFTISMHFLNLKHILNNF